MISFKINNVPTLFIKAFSAREVERILDFVRAADMMTQSQTRSVLFIDTPISAHTVEAVDRLKAEGYRVCFRDHHGIDGAALTDRDRNVELCSAKLNQMLGPDCHITVRRLHPACSTLVEVGEFEQAVAIIADPDPDGLTAAMKAAGISYPDLDNDAALLDGEPVMQVKGSPISQLLAKGMAALPSVDPKEPLKREQAQLNLFRHWVEAVGGNKKSQELLLEGVEAYDQAVQLAYELAENFIEVAPSVVLVDCTGTAVFDVGTLSSLVEGRTGCRISVIRKSLGPIAALHGIQYSLSVAKNYQSELNLQKLFLDQSAFGPQVGIISNVGFILHVSESVWHELALPRLREASAQNWASLA